MNQLSPIPEELKDALDMLTADDWYSVSYDVNVKLGKAERVYNAWKRYRKDVMQVPA
jgi:hypothetical protein